MPGLLSMGCLPGLPQVEDGCFMASRNFNMSSLPAIGGGVDNLPPAIGGGVDNLPEVASGMQSAESILEGLPQMSSDLPDMDALHCQPLAAHSQHHLPSTLEAPTEQRKTRKHQTKQRQVAAGKSLWDRPCLRSNTKADIPTIAEKYGQDLIEPPASWYDVAACRDTLSSMNITVPIERTFLLEIFAGCSRLTQVARDQGLTTGPPIDLEPAIGGGFPCNLLLPETRRVVWAIIVIFAPSWVHLGYPCTFWSAMAHFTRSRPSTEDECTRLEQLVFIVFATQVVKYQVSNLRHASVENPPACRSWSLELVEDMLHECCLSTVDFDCCMYGSVDPGNLMAYKKPMRLACSIDLRALHIRCSKMHQHQIVHGTVQSGPRKGTRRSRVSGEYTFDLCRRWVSIMRVAIGT